MLVGRVASVTLCALPLACGDRFGDPIVAIETRQGAGGTAAAGAGWQSGRGGAGAPGPTGLCGACTSSDECGDANDACIRHQDARFCGRDCDDQRGCPDGYSCAELDHSQLFQCVPQNGCPEPVLLAPPLDDIRQYVFERINAERVAHYRQPLEASGCLDDLAQDSAVDFARTDEPLGKYVRECDPIWPDCACAWTGEAEMAITRYGLDWTTAVEHALGSYRDSRSDRFVHSFLDNDVNGVGVGFWISGDEAWIALSFR